MSGESTLPSLKSHISLNSFLHIPESCITAPCINVIFFLPGNPGLISYYYHFLSSVADGLSSTTTKNGPASQPQHSFAIYGASLFGFELGDPPRPEWDYNSELIPHAPSQAFTHTLQEQIDFTYHRLHTVLSRVAHSLPQRPRMQVTLVGHSLGAYLAVKVLERYRSVPAGEQPGFEIKSLILLMAPIGDLAQSPHGRKASPPVVYVPFLPDLTQGIVRGLAFLLPKKFFRWLVTYRMGGLPSGLADSAVDATVSFLRSSGGVKQAISLARDELQMITEIAWEKALWSDYGGLRMSTGPFHNTALPSCRSFKAKICLYFAQEDGWMDQGNLKKVKEAVAYKAGLGVEMHVAGGVRHDFPVRGRESTMVAGRVVQWIQEKGEPTN